MHLLEGPSTFIIDEDDTGESADVVAIEETDDTIVVSFWHLKYAEGEVGRRASDLYVVCGHHLTALILIAAGPFTTPIETCRNPSIVDLG